MTLRLVSAHGKDLLNSRDKARLRGSSKTEAIDVDEDPGQPEMTTASAYNMLDLMIDAAFNTCLQCRRAVLDNGGSEDQENLAGVLLPCFDLMCSDCFAPHKEVFDADPQVKHPCPMCSAMISGHYVSLTPEGLEAARESKEATVPQPKAKKAKYEGPHTKTRALLNDLARTKNESLPLVETGESPIKSVVFSEFTSHLDLIGRALRDHGHDFLRIDGTMNLAQRRKVLDAFNNDDHFTVLLASIKAAGQGLNLTAASKVYIMEPLWNPAAEQQAVDRVHRLGQSRDVVITRYLMEESIEVKIRQLQEAKREMADISMNPNHKALSKQEIRDENTRRLREFFKPSA